MKRTLVRNTAIGVVFTCTSNFASACVIPHTWRWWDNTAYEELLLSGPGVPPYTYAFAFAQAVPVWLATNLDAGIGPNGEGKVVIENGVYSAPKDGWARVWSGGLECTQVILGVSYDAGTCNTSTYKATRARIYFNDTYMASASQNVRKLGMLHELGHVFGLSHVPTVCDSFMTEVVNYDANQYLTEVEIAWINLTYN